MVELDTSILVGTAAGLACFHTLIGIDHSVPFVVLGRTRGWSLRRTLLITGLCGWGHVGSSVLVGGFGVILGVALKQLTWIESVRGALAAWLLVGFGLAYACWAWVRSARGHRHAHAHTHSDGTVHCHVHDHREEHLHPHGVERSSVTPWILFIMFAFGPCEALIPLMLAPAIAGAWAALVAVVVVFSSVTVATMLGMVAVGYLGLDFRPVQALVVHRRLDAFAGLAIAGSGAAVMLLGI